MKLNQLTETNPPTASYTRDRINIIVVNRLKNGKVEQDVSEIKEPIAGIVIQDLGLTSLEGLPKIIKGNLLVANNNISSFEGGPEEVHGVFDVSFNPVSSFNGMPSKLYELIAVSNGFTSLHNIHKHITEFVRHGQTDQMTRVSYTKHGFGDRGNLTMGNKRIHDSVLGCLLIPGFTRLSISNQPSGPYYKVMMAVNGIAGTFGTQPTMANVIALQDQLIDDDLDAWAEL